MNLTETQLRNAALAAGLTGEQTDRLWNALRAKEEADGRPRFDAAHLAYYLGALIVIGAMGWFMNRAWDGLGGPGLFGVATCYGVCFLLGGRSLWQRNLRVPGGLVVAMAVCQVPLAAFGIERWTGFWPAGDPGSYQNFHPYINGSWIIMEAATVAAGLVALRFYRFSFLTAPIAYALWFMSMDLTDLVVGHRNYGETRELITALFGAVMLLATYLVDLCSSEEDFTFWGYLFGLAAFWGGLSVMDSHNEWSRAGYCAINLALIALALLLDRRAFLVFGAIGFFGYLGHLAYSVFADSALFPVVLTLIGLLVIAGGLQYQRRRRAIDTWVAMSVRPRFGRLVPRRLRFSVPIDF